MLPYDTYTDAISNAVLALQAAGWTVTDGDRDGVTMKHPDGDAEIRVEFA